MDNRLTSHLSVLYLDIHVPESGSLKSKRHVLKSLKDRLRNKFNVSVAELGELEKWQRSVLGVAMISSDKRRLAESIQAVIAFVESDHNLQLLDSHIEQL